MHKYREGYWIQRENVFILWVKPLRSTRRKNWYLSKTVTEDLYCRKTWLGDKTCAIVVKPFFGSGWSKMHWKSAVSMAWSHVSVRKYFFFKKKILFYQHSPELWIYMRSQTQNSQRAFLLTGKLIFSVVHTNAVKCMFKWSHSVLEMAVFHYSGLTPVWEGSVIWQVLIFLHDWKETAHMIRGLKESLYF